MNSAFADFVGLSLEQIIGKTTFELVKQQDVAQLGRDSDLEVMRTGKPIFKSTDQMVRFFQSEGDLGDFFKAAL